MAKASARCGVFSCLLGISFIFLAVDAHASFSARKPHSKIYEDDLYQQGVQLYADGQLKQSLAVFKRIVREYPQNPSARAALERVQDELKAQSKLLAQNHAALQEAQAQIQARYSGGWSQGVNDFLVATLPSFVDFDQCLGKAYEGLGTLKANQGRIDQLLAERSACAKKGRHFRKADELRALSRRMPAIQV